MHWLGGLVEVDASLMPAVYGDAVFRVRGAAPHRNILRGADGEGRGYFDRHDSAERRDKKQTDYRPAPGQRLSHKTTIPRAMCWASEYFRSMFNSGSERRKVSI